MAFILISGSNGSGKSLFAEQLISKCRESAAISLP